MPVKKTDGAKQPIKNTRKPAGKTSRLGVTTRKKAADTTPQSVSEIAINEVSGVPKNAELQRTNLVITKAEYLKIKTFALKNGEDLQDLLYRKNHGWISELPD